MNVEKRVRELDGVRGIACLLVVLWHCVVGIAAPSFLPMSLETRRAVIWLMPGGVDMFFVLSGFLIGGILLDNKGAANFFRAFWTRRVARIFPVYILLLLTYIAALGVRPHIDAPWMDEFLLISPLPLWPYLTFTQNFAMVFAAKTGAFWVAITWTLAVEEQFYFLFPGIVHLLARRSLIYLAIACVVAAPMIRIVEAKFGDVYYWIYFSTLGRIDTLMLGVLVACAVRSEFALKIARGFRWPLDILTVAALAVVVDGRIPAAISANVDSQVPAATSNLAFSLLAAIFAYGILRIFLVGDGLYRMFLRNRFLVGIGLISYAWYMYHQAINGLVHGLLFRHAPLISTYSQFAVACLVLAVSAGLAAISTRYFEQPFRDLARRMPYRFEQSTSSTCDGVARGA
jgi:peptidoglycan/LPS O-acetylase OafA/YrhL